jgi:hypothetical protein
MIGVTAMGAAATGASAERLPIHFSRALGCEAKMDARMPSVTMPSVPESEGRSKSSP